MDQVTTKPPVRHPWRWVTGLFVALCLLADFFPHRGPPQFRYTGSDPAVAVWNLGWPLATAIYDCRSGLHVGPMAYVAALLQGGLLLGTLILAAVWRWYCNLPRWRTAAQQHGRFWAWAFLVFGIYALACIPAVFLVEHFQWWEWQALIHLTSFFACIACAASALMYLVMSSGQQTGRILRFIPARPLAYVAVVLAGGYLILFFFILMMLTFAGTDF